MHTDRVYAFSQELSSAGVLLCFNGPFSHALIEEFGRALRNYLQQAQEKNSSISDVFSVYVEQAQNIQRYISHAYGANQAGIVSDDLRMNAIVMIAREGDHFAVCSGNRVRPEDAPRLRERLDALRDVDKAQLKAMYKQALRAPAPTDASVGAGLGFIGMARVASAPLGYTLEPHGESVFFSLRVVI